MATFTHHHGPLQTDHAADEGSEKNQQRELGPILPEAKAERHLRWGIRCAVTEEAVGHTRLLIAITAIRSEKRRAGQ